jgi:hypothetical protein
VQVVLRELELTSFKTAFRDVVIIQQNIYFSHLGFRVYLGYAIQDAHTEPVTLTAKCFCLRATNDSECQAWRTDIRLKSPMYKRSSWSQKQALICPSKEICGSVKSDQHVNSTPVYALNQLELVLHLHQLFVAHIVVNGREFYRGSQPHAIADYPCSLFDVFHEIKLEVQSYRIL